MLKIMLIDDEYYFRQALKVSLPWEELGFEIAGEFENGEAALQQIDLLNPEIVLVDINMPVMNGLQFSEILREKGYNIKIIILTGHNEFEYAKQAVRLGVHNYISKPLDEEELEKTLLELKGIIENERKTEKKIESMKEEVKVNFTIVRDKLLLDLFTGKSVLDSDIIMERLTDFNIHIMSSSYRVVVMEKDESGIQNEDAKQQWYSIAVNSIGEIFGKHYPCVVCSDNYGRVCTLAGYETEIANKPGSDFFELLEKVRQEVCRSINCKAAIGIGNGYSDIKNISSSYKEALTALESKLLTRGDRVICFSSEMRPILKGSCFSSELRTLILAQMRLGKKEDTSELIHKVFRDIRYADATIDMLITTSLELVSVCDEFLAESGKSLKNIFNNHFNPTVEIKRKNSLNELEDWIKYTFTCALDYIYRNKAGKISKNVMDALEYIRYNYSNEDLSVEDIANHVYVGSKYLSHIFKKEMGITIVEFLTELRLKKAKELIDAGNCSISNITEKVGYSNTEYFIKCFKKYYNISPAKFIKSKGENADRMC